MSAAGSRRVAFVGREAELAQLAEAAERLRAGTGGLVTIRGEAGTGKTRLVQELHASMEDDAALWVRAQARVEGTNTPYHVLADLVRDVWGIGETEPPDVIAGKIEANTARLLPEDPDAAVYLGRLFGLESSELAGVGPEAWRARVYELLSSADTGPTVIHLEDLHWADPSSVALLRYLTSSARTRTLWVATYRPPFELVADPDGASRSLEHTAIELDELSEGESDAMLHALLDADELPPELAKHVREAARGNPYRLEETVRTLIESETLVPTGDRWRLAHPIARSDAPMDLTGVLEARVDRLGSDAQRVLREAAVIGREVPFEILSRMTGCSGDLEESLADLERRDLLHATVTATGLEYVFKHDLTQEAVYEGVVEETRPVLHERLADVLESMFVDRTAEVSEDLAFHYERGLSLDKAVQYLMLSGQKSHARYALEEADDYYRRAFELVASAPEQTDASRALLVDILGAWGMIFPFRGDFEGLRATIGPHRKTVEAISDPGQLAGFYIAMSAGAWGCGIPEEGVELAERTREMADAAGHPVLSALARNALAWSGLEMGALDEAIETGWEGHRLCKDVPGEQLPQYATLHGVGIAHWYKGDVREGTRTADYLHEYSESRGSQRGVFAAAIVRGHAAQSAGRFADVAPIFGTVEGLSADPVHQWGPQLNRGIAWVEMGRLGEAERELERLLAETEGKAGFFAWPARAYLGVCDAGRGRFREADERIRDALRVFEETGNVCKAGQAEYLLGKVYRQLVERAWDGDPNILETAGIPGCSDATDAQREAERWLARAVERAEGIGAQGVACPAYLELARLHVAMGRAEQAREWATRALEDATDRGADGYAVQARELLAVASG